MKRSDNKTHVCFNRRSIWKAGIRAEYVSNIETLEFRSKEKVP